VILKIFSAKNFARKLAFFTQNKAKLRKNNIIILVFVKNTNYFAENCQKSQKIVIITSTPGPKPTIVSYSDSVAKTSDGKISQVRFEKKYNRKNDLAYIQQQDWLR
jgi:hypothetical protein